MSGERKSIVINANSLLGGGGGGAGGGGARRQTKRRGERKIRPSSIVQPSTLKKTLLERIKQHQRTRERARDHHGDGDRDKPLTQDGNSHTNNVGDDNTFSQSIDFLRKLAMKRRQQQQQTQKQRGNVSTGTGVPEAKTPESKMLNQVAETLHNGEILTNTGLLGLPVVQMPQHQTTNPFQSQVVAPPMISLGAMPMPMTHEVTVTQTHTQMPPTQMPVATPPNITELADMYNNTIANVSEQAPSTDTASAAVSASASELPLHIPNNPDDYLPSIFIKEEPPHGCLKNGKKPTFREWATKMLGFPSEEPAPPTGDGSSTSVAAGTAAASASASESINPITGMRVKIRKTKKKSYRIGKHDDVVGVLLKNKKDQNHIRTQHLALKQKTIGEIRKYLYDHHLLKIGSNAPPDVLRRMYEDSILTGDVKNTNNDVLLHNFMSGGGGE
jgi:hypothetical protein